VVTITLKGPGYSQYSPVLISVRVVRSILYIHVSCTLYRVRSRRPISGDLHHRHSQPYRLYHLPYPGLIRINRLINTRA
jgi:hypothetical protein